MSSASAVTMPTVGVISRRLDQPIHRIEYVIRSRGIQPQGIAGNARVYTEASVDLIAAELRRIDSARAGEVSSCR